MEELFKGAPLLPTSNSKSLGQQMDFPEFHFEITQG